MATMQLRELVTVTDRMGHLIEQILALHRTTNDQFVANFTTWIFIPWCRM